MFLLLLAIIVQATGADAMGASDERTDNRGDLTTEDWHITADEITYNKEQDRFEARGDVVIQKAGRRLTADSVQYSRKNGKASATGHVVMAADGDVLSGERMEIDLDKEEGTMHQGQVMLGGNHFHVRGGTIEKTGPQTYVIREAVVTTCDGDRPDWKITANYVEVTVDGYGFARNAAFWARDIPLMYSPFLMFPAKTRRQSGFLVPQMGYSDRKGSRYLQPYYWAIGRSSDATFYGDFMKERGIKAGVEYRYALAPGSKGAAMFDYLNDLKTDQGILDDALRWGYVDAGQDFMRPNDERYWWRAKIDQQGPWEFKTQVDMDIVSDQDYLPEFQDGYTGYDEANAYYLKTFGRGFEDANSPVRLNRLNLNRVWFDYSLNAELRWYDNVVSRRWKETDDTLQKMPSIRLDGAKQNIGDSGLFWDLETEYTHFYSIDNTRGHRGDVYPRIYLPLRYENYFAFEPSVGLRETFWNVDRWKTDEEQNNRMFHREIYDLRLDLSTEVHRIFSIDSMGYDRMRHAIRPRIVYTYIPHVNQEDLPQFDPVDRIDEENLITYSLLQTFTLRGNKLPSFKPEDGNVPAPDMTHRDYRTFCRFQLTQSYDINKVYADDPEPFSPILIELDVTPGSYVYLSADGQWSPYEGRLISHNVMTRLSDDRGDWISVDHRYLKEQKKVAGNESILLNTELVLKEWLSAYGRYERNLRDGNTLETRVGLRYKAQCWTLALEYADLENEQTYGVRFHLTGLGDS